MAPAKPEAGASGADEWDGPVGGEIGAGGRTGVEDGGSGGDQPIERGGAGGNMPTGTAPGAACESEGERACGRTGNGNILECADGTWTLVETCLRGTRCVPKNPRCEPIEPQPGPCDENTYRDASGACVPTLTLGESCSGDEQCVTEHRVDAVCCESACEGQCQTCDPSGSCVRAQSGAPARGRPACTNAGTICGGSCDGSSDECVYPGSEQTCDDATCSSDRTSTVTAVCSGNGQCLPPETTNCSSSSYCSDGRCVAKATDDTECEAAAQCQSGNCSADSTGGNGLCCPIGHANCGSCVDLRADDSNCGSCSNACAANKACQSGVCKCLRNALPTTCGGCGVWDFESDTTENWDIDTDPNWPVDGGDNNGVTNVTSTQTHVHGGNRGLAVSGLANGQVISVAVPLCGTGSVVNLAGYTMSAWVYLTGTELAFESFMFFDAWGASDAVRSPVLTGSKIVAMNSWHHVEATFSSAVQASHVAVRLNPELSWTGIVYIDQIELTPP